MNRIIYLSVFIIIAAVILKSCNSPEGKVKAAESKVTESLQDLNKARDSYDDEVKKFRKEMEQKIADNEMKIADFNFKIANEKLKDKLEYEQKTNALELRNKTMKKKLDEYKGDNIAVWESFKSEYNNDMNELQKSIKDLEIENVKQSTNSLNNNRTN